MTLRNTRVDNSQSSSLSNIPNFFCLYTYLICAGIEAQQGLVKILMKKDLIPIFKEFAYTLSGVETVRDSRNI